MTAPADVGAVVRSALDRGWVTPAVVHDPGIRAWDASRSHAVVVVEVGDGGLVVKQHRRDGDDVQGSREREVLAHRVATTVPELRGLAPGVVADGPEGVLVVERVPGTDLATRRRDRRKDRVQDLARVAAALGRWHAGARSVARTAPRVRPWVLDALAADRPSFVRSNEGVAGLLAKSGEEIAGLLDALDGAWTATTLVHGDLRADNVIINSDAVTFIDWETAGHGDPAWDIGALLAEVLTDAGVREVGDRLTPGVRAELRAALRGWQAQASESSPGLTERLGLACAGRLLLRALQVAGASPEESAEEQRLCRLAVGLAQQPAALARATAGAA